MDTDFDIAFHGRDEKASKGSIRQKILTIPHMFGLFSGENEIEEDFRKNVVHCSIASSNNLCTLGLIATPSARPMTLLRGNELNTERAGRIRLVLSKKRTDSLFSDMIVGSPQLLLQHLDTLKNRVSPELKDQALATVVSQ